MDGVGGHTDPIASVIFWITLIFLFGIIGRSIAKKMKIPSVLGELLMGVVVGNVCYFFGMQLAVILREGSGIFTIMTAVFSGTPLTQAVHAVVPDVQSADQVVSILSQHNGSNWFKIAYVIDVFSRYGVIFLLFMVGLESSIQDLKQTGRESFQVAITGVLAPMALGLIVTTCMMPEASFSTDLFVSATLAATSIGITSRVLKDLKQLQTDEARTILGAAMLDDILGLMLLAIVSSIVIHGSVELGQIGQVIMLASLFFIVALWIGPKLLNQTIKCFHRFKLWEAKLFTAFLFLMGLAWFATMMQLATIIGAFVAGLIVHDGLYSKSQSVTIRELFAPLEAILAPLFFMLIGIQVKLETFLNWHVLFLASGLITAAIIGKLLSGLGANSKRDRLLVGIGMLPRGEVGLVFASIGRTLGVISDQLFTAIILMVITTTIIAPLWLKTRYARVKSHDN